MNQKLFEQITSFIESVGYYLKCEYEDTYYQQLNATDDQLFDFIGSYYMGGSTVPETARYVVDFINIRVDQ
jgi:hypothetical protein